MLRKNPEKAKAYRKAYYLQHREEILAKASEWNKSHREQRNAFSRKWEKENKARYMETVRKRYDERMKEDPQFTESRRKACRNNYTNNREKRLELERKKIGTPEYIARYIANNAMRRGEITRPLCCEQCAKPNKRLSMHHHDYAKPLDVIFLCALCHGEKRRKHPRSLPYLSFQSPSPQ